MAMPTLDSFAERLYAELAPVTFAEAELDYPLAKYVAALGAMFQVVEDYSRDQLIGDDFAPGWSQLLDLSRAPTVGLTWLAQFIGVAVTAGLSDAQQRAQIAAVGGWNRGTPATIAAAAGLYLTGNKTVIFRERDAIACPTQPAYGLTVITFVSETPNPTATEAAIRAQKPAGIVLNYETLVGQDFENLYLNNPDFQGVYTTYTTFQGVLDDDPGH
jgi:hypothetical protein